MPPQKNRRLSWPAALLLVPGYVAFDWAGHVQALDGINVTPWSPAPALGLLFLIRFGGWAVPPLALAIFVADVAVRQLPLPLPLIAGLAVQLALGYWAMAGILRGYLSGKSVFADRRSLIQWVAVTIVGSLFNNLLLLALLGWSGYLPQAMRGEMLAHHWLGDVVGILVAMPLLAMLTDQRGRARLFRLLPGGESLGLLATVLALGVALAGSEPGELSYLPLLFLPIAWAAARQGLAGAVLTTSLAHLGVIVASHLLDFPAATLLELQVLLVVLALSGFLIGVVVDEKQRLSTDLQQTLRLAAAGEMAGALSHELHQPLTALLAYARACQQLLHRDETGERLSEVINRMVGESNRAAEVVSRLREFFRTGTTRLERIWFSELLSSATLRLAPQAKQQGIELVVDAIPACALWVDRLQIEVVLRNLIANAFEAVAERPPGQRVVRLSAHLEARARVCVVVQDSGPGVAEEMVSQLFEAFRSSKASGMGLGLTISRAIIEAHGGQLWAEAADFGLFKLTLPIEEYSIHGH